MRKMIKTKIVMKLKLVMKMKIVMKMITSLALKFPFLPRDEREKVG